MATSPTPAERIATAVYPDSEQASAAVAQEIAALLRARALPPKT